MMPLPIPGPAPGALDGAIPCFHWCTAMYCLALRVIPFPVFARRKVIALVNEGIGDEEVLRRLHSFLDSLHCLGISAEDFELCLPALLREADVREQNKQARRKKKKKITFIISEPPTEEDKELFINESDDFDWQVVFAGEFPKDYEIPICFADRIVDDFRGLKTVLKKPREKVRDEWVLVE